MKSGLTKHRKRSGKAWNPSILDDFLEMNLLL